MNADTVRESGKRADPTLTVFVGFDNSEARTRASEVCDCMTAKFWPDMEFELHLCDFAQLGEPDYRQQAIKKAAAAHVVVMATSLSDVLDLPMTEWMEAVCALRHEREGALVALVDPAAEEEQRESTEQHLRRLAHKAGLDYLTHAPDCRTLQIPDEADWLDARIKLSSVLESILEKSGRPVEAS